MDKGEGWLGTMISSCNIYFGGGGVIRISSKQELYFVKENYEIFKGLEMPISVNAGGWAEAMITQTLERAGRGGGGCACLRHSQ